MLNYHEDEVAREVGLGHEEEHVERQKGHVLEDGDYDAHGVKADETLDSDVMAQVLHSGAQRSGMEQTGKMRNETNESGNVQIQRCRLQPR